jgi:hypothetical protein
VRPAARLIVAVATIAAVVVASTALAAEPANADDLRARFDAARSQAELGIAQPSPERMAEVRRTLGLPLQASVAGWSVDVPADPVLATLRGETSNDFVRAASRIELLEGSLDAALASDVPDPARIATALGSAYSGIVRVQPDPGELVLRAISNTIEAALYRLGRAFGGSGAWILVLVLAAVVGLGLLQLSRGARLLPDRLAPDRSGPRPATASNWSAMADAAIRAGDLREAVRIMYVALVVSLAARGLLADAPALTAGEARTAVRRTRPELLPAVVRATESYERVIYGGVEAGEQDIEQLRQATTLARMK